MAEMEKKNSLVEGGEAEKENTPIKMILEDIRYSTTDKQKLIKENRDMQETLFFYISRKYIDADIFSSARICNKNEIFMKYDSFYKYMYINERWREYNIARMVKEAWINNELKEGDNIDKYIEEYISLKQKSDKYEKEKKEREKRIAEQKKAWGRIKEKYNVYILNSEEEKRYNEIYNNICKEVLSDEELQKLLDEFERICIQAKARKEEALKQKEEALKQKEEAMKKITWINKLVNSINIEQEAKKEKERFLKKFQLTEDFIAEQYKTANKPFIRIQAEIDLTPLGIDRKLKLYNTTWEDKSEYYNKNLYFSDLSVMIAEKLAEIFNGKVVVASDDNNVYLNVEIDSDTINVASEYKYDDC